MKGKKDEKDEAYMRKERRHVAAMKKHKVPKRIIREEEEEAGMKRGGKVRGGGVERKGKTKGKVF